MKKEIEFKREECIKCKCPNCGAEMKQPEYLLDEYKKKGDEIYCSEECRYNAETGRPGEEY